MPGDSDTIAAIASAPGHSGVGVIRVSGDKAKDIATKLCKKDLAVRSATFSTFKSGKGEILDSGIALFFTKPASYTGEDVLEIHTHGNPHVMSLIINTVLEYGARKARPGEFTERAFLNGKMDLLQAEAVADLINAGSTSAVNAALSSLQGKFSENVSDINQQLINARAMVEGALDFPDEDFDPLEHYPVFEKINALKDSVVNLINNSEQGIKLRHGKKVVIFGKPNVGKSSLMNYFAQEDVAIVTDTAGTTRDSLTRQINLGGINIEMVDTAGLRDTKDKVEQEGIYRTQNQIKEADILVLLLEVGDDIELELEKISDYQKEKLVLVNKIDLTKDVAERKEINGTICMTISVKQEMGLEEVVSILKSIVVDCTDSESPFMARLEHLNAFQETLQGINDAERNLQNKQLELAAESLKLSQDKLEGVLGKTTADDILAEIFSRFCIGK